MLNFRPEHLCITCMCMLFVIVMASLMTSSVVVDDVIAMSASSQLFTLCHNMVVKALSLSLIVSVSTDYHSFKHVCCSPFCCYNGNGCLHTRQDVSACRFCTLCSSYYFSQFCLCIVWRLKINEKRTAVLRSCFGVLCKKKVQASRTRYRALGPELIPVYRPSHRASPTFGR